MDADQSDCETAEAARRLEARFRTIAAERMAGLPILNAALGVKAVGMCDWQGEWLSALVTPWFLNLVLMPVTPERAAVEAGTRAEVGAKRIVALPAGSFEFIWSHDEVLGPFSMCSLFSPVLEFADQETAEAAAAAALAAVLETTAAAEQEDAEMVRLWRGELPEPSAAEDAATRPAAGNPADAEPDLSRRGLLFGNLSSQGEP